MTALHTASEMDEAMDSTNESSVRDYIALMKPGVMSLVVFTGLVGLLIAPGSIHPLIGAVAIFCIAVGSGAGATLNMWYDRDIDAIMTRTSTRPLPAGRIVPEEAFSFGIALSLGSVLVMGVLVNWIAAGILAFAIFFYAAVYTVWLKRTTPQNIVIGGAAGAFPPMIGWAAVTGDISWVSFSLFLIVFLWTPPHFWALALYKNSDYQKAGVPMLPVIAGPVETKKQMLMYSYLLVLSSFMPVYLGAAGILYTVAAAMLGLVFIRHAWVVRHAQDDVAPRKMFGYSILYLFCLFATLPVDMILTTMLGKH